MNSFSNQTSRMMRGMFDLSGSTFLKDVKDLKNVNGR